MKARLTLVFEKEADEHDKEFFEEIARDNDFQAMAEEFGIGLESPTESSISFTHE